MRDLLLFRNLFSRSAINGHEKALAKVGFLAGEGEKLFRLASALVLKREESLVILKRKKKR